MTAVTERVEVTIATDCHVALTVTFDALETEQSALEFVRELWQSVTVRAWSAVPTGVPDSEIRISEDDGVDRTPPVQEAAVPSDDGRELALVSESANLKEETLANPAQESSETTAEQTATDGVVVEPLTRNGKHTRRTVEQKQEIVSYATKHGVMRAVSHFGVTAWQISQWRNGRSLGTKGRRAPVPVPVEPAGPIDHEETPVLVQTPYRAVHVEDEHGIRNRDGTMLTEEQERQCLAMARSGGIAKAAGKFNTTKSAIEKALARRPKADKSPEPFERTTDHLDRYRADQDSQAEITRRRRGHNVIVNGLGSANRASAKCSDCDFKSEKGASSYAEAEAYRHQQETADDSPTVEEQLDRCICGTEIHVLINVGDDEQRKALAHRQALNKHLEKSPSCKQRLLAAARA